MKTYFDPVLEYRIYIQKARTEAQKKAKLSKLAEKAHTSITRILKEYAAGEDIMDPEIFEREDIIAFAEAYGIQNDPQVIRFINRARTAQEWAMA